MEKSESENEWITQLQDKSSSHTRSSAAEALGKMKSRKAVEPLIAALKDEDDGVRRNAARALGLIGDVRAVDPLIALLRDKNCDVRKWIAEALVKLGWKPKDDEEKIWYFIAKKKWDECVKFGELAIEPLIASLKGWDEDISEGYESKVVLTLSKLGKPAVGPLIVALKDEDYYMRIRVITALGLIGDVRAVDPLIALLKDKDLSIRLHAAEALGKMKSRKAVDPLIAELKDEDDGVRRNAARALGLIGDVRAVDPLIAALKDEDAKVRERVAEALDMLGWKPKDDEEKIWYFIAKKKWDECVKFGELAVGSLIAALKDKSGDKDASNNVRKGAARALSKLGKPAVDTLIAALNDQNSDVRREAARALGLIGDVKAVPALVRTLTDWYAEMDSAKALDMLGWKPKSVEEEIHYLIAKRKESYLMDKRQRDLLRKRWSEVKDVLLKDVESGEYKLVENALYAFIGIGNEEIIPSLIDILNKKGDANMAEAYLNCGHDKLRSAASDWAKEHGYTIMYGGGTSPVWWGR